MACRYLSLFINYMQNRSQLFHCNPNRRSKESHSLSALVDSDSSDFRSACKNAQSEQSSKSRKLNHLVDQEKRTGKLRNRKHHFHRRESSNSGHIFATRGGLGFVGVFLAWLFGVFFKSIFKTCSKFEQQKHGLLQQLLTHTKHDRPKSRWF